MHKENLCINPSKPRAAIRTARNKREESAATPSTSVPLHTRLPSADSGIQADSGFDSLSRYKGETFLSTLNSQRLGADTDHVGLDPDLIGAVTVSSHCSSYLNNVISQESLPRSQQIVSSGSKSGVTVSKPVPPLKPTLTSSPSNPRHPRATARSAQTALCGNPPLPPERFDDKTPPKGKPIPSTTGVTSSARISNTLRPLVDAVDPVNLSQNVPASRPVAAQRKDTSVSVIHQQTRHLASSIDPLDSDRLPKMKAAATSNDLDVSLSDSSICFPSHSLPSDQPALLSSPTGTVPALDLDSSGNSIKTYELGCKRSPGTTLNLRVLKPSNQGQSCKSLTRPLKLDAPSKLTVKTVQTTTLGPHSAHLVPTFNQHSENKHQHQVSPVKPKPKIAPRPSILTKILTPSQILSSRISVTTFSELPSSTSSLHTGAVQSSRDTCHKQEVPVVHRVKTIDLHSGRTEIPVTHVFSKSASRKYQNFTRPPSILGRHTPDRDKHAKQQSDHHPIYENIRLEARNGLDFDELDIQVKHSEIILNHSDELISDALRLLLVASPSSSLSHSGNGPVVSSSQLVDASPHGGGDGGKSQGEHVLPIFDARTGALHSAARRPYWSDWTTRQAAFSNGDGRGAVTWSQRKEKIDSALTWLRQELANLRDMDTHLILQFHRCQDTIESLKNQRESWEGLSEEGEDGDFWEDYELNEYNRCYLDSPGGSCSNQFSPENCQPSLQDVTVMSFPVSQVCLQQVSETASEQHGVTQDIEITL